MPSKKFTKINKPSVHTLSQHERERVIRYAWEDRRTFDEIFERTGLSESEVIHLMRNSLKPKSFKNWRARVTGRITKHRKLLRAHLQE